MCSLSRSSVPLLAVLFTVAASVVLAAPVHYPRHQAMNLQCYPQHYLSGSDTCERFVWTVHVPHAGVFQASTVTNPIADRTPARATVNGVYHTDFDLDPSSFASPLARTSVLLKLNAGINTVEIVLRVGLLDSIEVAEALPLPTGGGARLPYIELEAENATTNAQIIGPDFR